MENLIEFQKKQIEALQAELEKTKDLLKESILILYEIKDVFIKILKERNKNEK